MRALMAMQPTPITDVLGRLARRFPPNVLVKHCEVDEMAFIIVFFKMAGHANKYAHLLYSV